MGERTVLQDDPHRRVVRIGDTVRRPLHPWSPTVHEVLRHLEAVGFPYAPRLLGIDDDGREILTYLDGESGGAAWAKVVDDAGLVAMARLLREYHDAVRGFRPTAASGWAAHPGDFGADDLVCHGAPGPPDRRRRLELFAGAYGLTTTAGLVDEVIGQQHEVLQRAGQLAAEGHQPQVTWRDTGVLDETAARVAWSRAHRHLFD